ncbi:hypothetical protein [Caloramator proteoclasticus]|uniref:Uncharacterized protein n=1 Tax=Caloramator proteoclasticus DSM 10124 TaxID=1121262 RepID=A0A1M4X7A2_9CLOT|nr:hypothetical protein [Caloramator proteoclasticus]SHE89337.1 hypothetical protein SAMN02746091_01329 [Caloramator proteoclasticus DSM 10124]
MKIEEIMMELIGNYNNDCDDFELLTSLAPENCYYIDRFPLIVKSFEKYEQVELYYKKVINDNALIESFRIEELKFVNVIKKLWLYSDLIVQSNLLEESYGTINSILEGSSEYITNLKKNMENSGDDAITIENVNHLDLLVKLAVREIVFSKLLFVDLKILIIAYGLCFQVYIHDLNKLQFLNKIISTEGLYLRPFMSN